MCVCVCVCVYVCACACVVIITIVIIICDRLDLHSTYGRRPLVCVFIQRWTDTKDSVVYCCAARSVFDILKIVFYTFAHLTKNVLFSVRFSKSQPKSRY